MQTILFFHCEGVPKKILVGTPSQCTQATRIVSPREIIESWDNIEKIRNSRVAIDVFKSLHKLLPEDLNGYFKRYQHEINTRGNTMVLV